jgi:hypothetical protein
VAAEGSMPTRSRAPQDDWIAERLRRGDQEEKSRVVRQALELPDEALLDPPHKCVWLQQPKATRELRHVQASRQLQQRKGIAAGLGDDPLPDPLIEYEPDARAEQRAGIVVSQAVKLQLGDVLELLAGIARREHDPDRLREQTPGDKRQRQRGRLIQPLCIVDHAQQRTFFGDLREPAQHRQPDEKPVGHRARGEPEHDLERVALWGGKPAR